MSNSLKFPYDDDNYKRLCLHFDVLFLLKRHIIIVLICGCIAIRVKKLALLCLLIYWRWGSLCLCRNELSLIRAVRYLLHLHKVYLPTFYCVEILYLTLWRNPFTSSNNVLLLTDLFVNCLIVCNALV